ncbi:MAG: aminotransferase class V-fold PLP-dependent enzyme [bacterium]
MSKVIYLDYNATTPIAPEVLEVMLPYFKDKYANPSSKYKTAMDIAAEVELARSSIAKFLGAKFSDELLFTGSATESINHAIRGCLKAFPKKRHIITTEVEHPAVLETCKDLERDGYRVSYLKVNQQGELLIEEFKQALSPDTGLVSIMYANNETGVVFPIDELSRITKEVDPDIFFHTDATQAIGKRPMDLNSQSYKNIDFLSMSGHKIYAPKGIGLLFTRKGARLRKFITGGHHEFNKRGGTLNVPFIIGMAKAFELLTDDFNKNLQKKLSELRDSFEKEISTNVPYIRINGLGAKRSANTTNISFDCIEGESILFQLDKMGFCISSGSACTSGSLEPSHVLRAMHVPLTSAHSSLRISLGRYTTKEDVDSLAKALPGVIQRLREISPFWDRKLNKPNEMAAQYSCSIK